MRRLGGRTTGRFGVNRLLLAFLIALLLIAATAHAEWSSNPAVNLTVADASGDQVQPKVAPTDDGGCYISWLDSIGNGFDVRVQKLDSAGNEVFPHNGVLVADRGFTWTTDYDLDVDASGNALLAYRDDRGGGIEIAASKVSPTGTLLWGAGVQLTSGAGFVASPKIAGTSDGEAVVAWTEDSSARVQKLAADGAPVWGAPVTLTPAAGTYTASDLHDAGTDVILSIVHQTGPEFWAPKQLRGQKLDATGASLWGGGDPVVVFDAGSLQFGNYPPFVPDGLGGAVFSWYDTSTQLQCYAQRILANGTEAFPHNGSAASTNATRVRVSPSASFNAVTGETFLFWEEQNSAQSQSGLYGQKFDASGVRQWSDDGVTVVPVGADEITQVRCLTEGTGAFVFWCRSPAFGQDRLYGARLDGAGAVDIPTFDVASTTSGKSRLDVARDSGGRAILAWQDDRSDAGDILAQNVNSDGSLGNSWVGVPDEDHVATLFLGAPRPNPTGGGARFECAVATPGDVLFEVCDVRGRLLRSWTATAGAERRVVSWDGCDRAGEPVAGGVYFLRVTNAGETRTTKVTVVR